MYSSPIYRNFCDAKTGLKTQGGRGDLWALRLGSTKMVGRTNTPAHCPGLVTRAFRPVDLLGGCGYSCRCRFDDVDQVVFLFVVLQVSRSALWSQAGILDDRGDHVFAGRHWAHGEHAGEDRIGFSRLRIGAAGDQLDARGRIAWRGGCNDRFFVGVHSDVGLGGFVGCFAHDVLSFVGFGENYFPTDDFIILHFLSKSTVDFHLLLSRLGVFSPNR